MNVHFEVIFPLFWIAFGTTIVKHSKDMVDNAGFSVKDKGIEYWQNVWEKNDVAFHNPETHWMLEKHSSLMFRKGETKNFFVPLCGKTVDMKWLMEQGHNVVGLDGVKKSLEDFCEEHDLEHTVEDAPNMGPGCQVFQAKDGKLKLYFGDVLLFNKSIEGQFDCIWDRGSLVALDRKDVKAYVALIKDILKPGGKILVETIEYDLAIFAGYTKPPPPHPVFESDMRSLFEPECTVEIVDRPRTHDDDQIQMAYYLVVKKCVGSLL